MNEGIAQNLNLLLFDWDKERADVSGYRGEDSKPRVAPKKTRMNGKKLRERRRERATPRQRKLTRRQ